MIDTQLRAEIRRLFFAEHWKVGTIAGELGIHYETVRRAINADGFVRRDSVRPSMLDPYKEFIVHVLGKHPRLRATRIYDMIVGRGFTGSAVQLRRYVRMVRPEKQAEAYLALKTLPGEQGQVDWGSFGRIQVGHASRSLSCFVLVLSWSRAMYAHFTLDQKLNSFMHCHTLAFEALGGVPRTLLYDRPRSPRRSRAVPSAPARARRALPLRAEALRPVPRKREGQGRARHPIPAALLLRRPALSRCP